MAKSQKLESNTDGRLVIVVVHGDGRGVANVEFQLSSLDRFAMGDDSLKLSKKALPLSQEMFEELRENTRPWQRVKLADGRHVFAVRGRLSRRPGDRASWTARKFSPSPQHIDEQILERQELAEQVRRLSRKRQPFRPRPLMGTMDAHRTATSVFPYSLYR